MKKPRGVGQPEGQNVQVTGIFLLEKEKIYWKQSRIRFDLTEGQRARNVSESNLRDQKFINFRHLALIIFLARNNKKQFQRRP